MAQSILIPLTIFLKYIHIYIQYTTPFCGCGLDQTEGESIRTKPYPIITRGTLSAVCPLLEAILSDLTSTVRPHKVGKSTSEQTLPGLYANNIKPFSICSIYCCCTAAAPMMAALECTQDVQTGCWPIQLELKTMSHTCSHVLPISPLCESLSANEH